MGKFDAGDVIRYPSGRLDYLVSIPGEEGAVGQCREPHVD